MMKNLTCGAVSAVALAVVAISVQAQVERPVIYVAVDGNDAWSGSLPEPNAAGTDGPVATVGRALARARLRRGEGGGGFTVFVRGGTYYLDKTVVLEAEDSGSPEAPTRIAAYEGETPRLVAGRRLTGWRPWRGKILMCDLEPKGLRGVVFRELYFNGQRQVLARYPNADPEFPNTRGWLYTEAPAEPGSKRAFVAYEGDLKAWDDLSQAEVFEFHRYNYYNTVVGVESVDLASRVVTLKSDTYNDFAGDGAERYFFQNLLEELDAPGEWYLDRSTSTVYLFPPEDIREAVIEVPVLDYAVHITAGTHDVRIEGLTVEVARRTGIQVEEARHCTVAKNTVRHCGVGTEIGGWATWENCCGIGLFGGARNRAVGNDISYVGGHGIKLTGGDWRTLAAAENVAENNHIHHTGRDWKQGCGVRLEGVGNRFSRNTVHDIPRMGVIFGGWKQVIELNHMYRLNLETCDTGAVYTGGRDGVTPWGSVVRYNYIHDVIGFGREHGKWVSPYYCWGIYLDDFASGVDVIGNIVEGTVRGGVHIHSGRHNRIENNILVGAERQQIEFNGWERRGRAWQSREPNAVRNWRERRELPAWTAAFPRLFATSPEDWVMMSDNVIRRNILVATVPGSTIYGWRRLPLESTTFEENLLWANGSPIRTGVGALAANPTGPEMCPNPGFEEGGPDEMPSPWGWYARPSRAITALPDDVHIHSGTRSLRVVCAPPEDPEGQFRFAMLKTPNITIEPGRSYRLACWVRADRGGIPVSLVAQSWRAKQHHWAREVHAEVGQEWQQLELGVHVPGPADPEYIPTMTDFYIRIDIRAHEGTCWIDDVSLREAEPVDEWKAWQERGHDVGSIVADPRFVDAADGDYRLQPDSPALKLGFEPIPLGTIGCYANPMRATWPLRGTAGSDEQKQ